MSLFKKLFINAAAIYTERIFEAFLQFALLAFILSKVGKEYYAAALLIISIQHTIDLGRGGIQKATLKYISEYKAKGDYSTANYILSSSTAMQGGIGIFGFLICFFLLASWLLLIFFSSWVYEAGGSNDYNHFRCWYCGIICHFALAKFA